MTRVRTVTAVLVFLAAGVAALPATLLEDAKQAYLRGIPPITSKVKRAQEVIMFGNQQNRPAEASFYNNAEKRAVTSREVEEDVPPPVSSTASSPRGLNYDESDRGDSIKISYPDQSRYLQFGNGPRSGKLNYKLGNDRQSYQDSGEDSKTVAQYEKGYQYGVGKAALDKHVENALLKSELYGEPSSLNQYRYYGGGDERMFPIPTKRSRSNTFRPMVPHTMPLSEPGSARLKRDLELDPEDVLALLSLWEAEHQHNNYPYRTAGPAWPHYANLDPADDYEPTIDDNQMIDDDEDQLNGGWMDGPVYPSSSTIPMGHYGLERRAMFYPTPQFAGYQYPVQKREGQWGGFSKDKRFMVSRKRQVGGGRDGVHSLAQLLNTTPLRDPGVPVYRRVVL